MTETQNPFAEPLRLPCGLALPNRLVKSAMSDMLGDGEGNPTGGHVRLYSRWAMGGAALSIVGEVQADPRFPESPGNLVLEDRSDFAAFRGLTIAWFTSRIRELAYGAADTADTSQEEAIAALKSREQLLAVRWATKFGPAS